MTLQEWLALSEAEQEQQAGNLDPYQSEPLLAAVRRLFIEAYGGQPGVESIHCGCGPGLGPYLGIFVRIKPGQPRVRLPKRYLGFPVYREHQRSRNAQ